jgi:UPF0271 protein
VAVVLEAFGDTAWRARLPSAPDAERARALLDALRALPGVVDVVVAEHHALVVLARGAPCSGVGEVIDEVLASDSLPSERREHIVRVRYDGADLADVAGAAGMSVEEVVGAHTGRTYDVKCIGFLPGFAYLRELDPRLVLPRLATPRVRVPALSVAIAGPYTAVYPFASPGGWRLLGEAVGFAPFDPRSGASMALGDRVRFVPLAPGSGEGSVECPGESSVENRERTRAHPPREEA